MDGRNKEAVISGWYIFDRVLVLLSTNLKCISYNENPADGSMLLTIFV
jgi:hypothetical protein